MSVFKLSFPKVNLAGFGAIEALVDQLIDIHGTDKGLLVCDPAMVELGFYKKLIDSDLNLSLFKDVKPNPDTNVVNAAFKQYKDDKAKFVIGFGGGNAVDTAKAVRILSNNPGVIADYNGIAQVKKLVARYMRLIRLQELPQK